MLPFTVAAAKLCLAVFSPDTKLQAYIDGSYCSTMGELDVPEESPPPMLYTLLFSVVAAKKALGDSSGATAAQEFPTVNEPPREYPGGGVGVDPTIM